jgi:hypothetical protein
VKQENILADNADPFISSRTLSDVDHAQPNVAEIDLRVQAIEFGRADQAMHGRSTFATAVGGQFIMTEFWSEITVTYPFRVLAQQSLVILSDLEHYGTTSAGSKCDGTTHLFRVGWPLR